MIPIIALLSGVIVQAVVYNRYLIGGFRKSSSKVALPLIAGLSFTNVIMATSIVVPSTGEYLLWQLIAALVVSVGSTVGAYRAKIRAVAGMTEYERRQNSHSNR
jgi:hypothetical protein